MGRADGQSRRICRPGTGFIHGAGRPRFLHATEAVQAGVSILGENYLQEAQGKIDQFELPVSWHFIGHLQSKKAKPVVRLFDLVHSVDSFNLAHEISKRAAILDKTADVLIQVNVSGEASKFGIVPEQLEPLLDRIQTLENVRVRGLMTMPPYFDQPERVRPFFARLRERMARVKNRRWSPNIRLEELSMGMSGDFETAIEEGATLVRVGTAIFGSRQ
ncbi:MAG: YggS family pyridoxal phosphate-dependent enzyme [Deltaproteobacteria bacterium]|nr:YggS family pyridoxal phosphate-dependent enzyme [Deltaproteobacteria bacterium]